MARLPKRSIATNKWDSEKGKAVHDPESYKPSPWSPHWRDDLIDFGTEGHHVIKTANDTMQPYLRQRVWGLGDTGIMENPFIVAFAGRNWKCPHDEIALGTQIALRMSERGLVVIHGNSKGTEKGACRRLRELHGKQIIVPHYGLVHF